MLPAVLDPTDLLALKYLLGALVTAACTLFLYLKAERDGKDGATWAILGCVFSLWSVAAYFIVDYYRRVLQRSADSRERERVAEVLKTMTGGQQTLAQSPPATRWLDLPLEKLVDSGRLEEAEAMAAEKLRQAFASGQDEQVELYRRYQQTIAHKRAGGSLH